MSSLIIWVARPTDQETIAIEKISLFINLRSQEWKHIMQQGAHRQSPEVNCKAEGERGTLTKTLHCESHREEQLLGPPSRALSHKDPGVLCICPALYLCHKIQVSSGRGLNDELFLKGTWEHLSWHICFINELTQSERCKSLSKVI